MDKHKAKLLETLGPILQTNKYTNYQSIVGEYPVTWHGAITLKYFPLLPYQEVFTQLLLID
jgi:hypothetical protein